MTALYMDGFDHYGGGNTDEVQAPALQNMATAGWSFPNGQGGSLNFDGFPVVGGPFLLAPQWGSRTGAYCLGMAWDTASANLSRRALPSSTTNLFVSFGFSVEALPESGVINFFRVLDGLGVALYTIAVTPTGAINISGSAVNATTINPIITPATWFFLEMQFNTAGNFVLRVNDALGTDVPALQTPLTGGTIAIIDLFPPGSVGDSWVAYLDDLFIRDSLGGINDTFLGDRRIATMLPDEDTDHNGWDPHFYKQISVGHAQLANRLTGTNTTQSLTAAIKTAQAVALNIGNQDFTLESFVRFDQLPLTTEYYTIFNKWNESSVSGRSYQLRYTGPTDGNVLEFRTSTDGSSGTVVSKIRYPWSPEYGVWYHVALCRTAGQLLLFVDGQQLGLPISDSDTYFASITSAISIGTQLNSSTTTGAGVSGSTLVGRLDETRFTNGIGRYTSSFTAPTTKFPRGLIDDPDWASVVLLMGYDQTVEDESSFLRTMVSSNGATNILAVDGDPPGVFTTVNKLTPNDNTFIRASLNNATNIFTMTTNPTAGNSVTVGTTDGTTPAVYTFVASLVSPFDVLIGATYVDTLNNLIEAINDGVGEGVVYGTGTTSNADVLASGLPAGQIMVTALIAGSSGNSIAVAETGPGVWTDPANLSGGSDIPGRRSFKLQRPPTNTTIISAIQLTTRASKTDSGAGSFRAGLVGPLGVIEEGPTHGLSVGGAVYNDIIEIDPDTSGPISPTTLINGRVTVNRTV